MSVTLLGMVMLVRFVQPRKALVLILVKFTLVGRVTVARLAQYWNALLPIMVTLLGMVMLVKLLQP